MNFQDIIENARRWAVILNEDSERGGTISKATINGAASLLRTLADKLAFLVEHKEAAERKVAELEQARDQLSATIKQQRETVNAAENEARELREQVQRLHVALGHEVRGSAARGQTINALRRELAEADAKANEVTEKLTTLEAAYNSLRTLWEQQRRTIAKYQECGVRTAVIIDYESDYVGRPGKRRWTLNDRGEPVQVNGGANTIDSSHTHKPVHGGRPDTQATRAEGGEPSETAGMHVPAVPLTLREIGRPIDLEASSGEYSEGHIITDDGHAIPFCRFSINVGGTD